ncbi:hypothetical protein [Tateyamaria sp. Alg231-49]|uniref:hypothetical protein n=1 Tax=Tateyamaria sp. Alg231-49 TaxID=1922219 RepID=UPI00131EF623|nr:hypothetical protein [Tateyamaria sp. Alg231-49]
MAKTYIGEAETDVEADGLQLALAWIKCMGSKLSHMCMPLLALMFLISPARPAVALEWECDSLRRCWPIDSVPLKENQVRELHSGRWTIQKTGSSSQNGTSVFYSKDGEYIYVDEENTILVVGKWFTRPGPKDGPSMLCSKGTMYSLSSGGKLRKRRTGPASCLTFRSRPDNSLWLRLDVQPNYVKQGKSYNSGGKRGSKSYSAVRAKLGI